ncbi:MAG: phospho-N-acetylmuramoyl-pentapeptide-transferase [Acidobacteriota bacterium]
MLYHFLYSLHDVIGPFNVFKYITFRTALAILSAMLISFLFGPSMIRTLKKLQVEQRIREEGPQFHKPKAGTPTMGGILIIISVIIPTLLWADIMNLFVWVIVTSMIVFGTIGFIDDFMKIRRGKNLGLTISSKLAIQFAAGFLLGLLLIYLSKYGVYTTKLSVPFFKTFTPDLGLFYILFTIVVIIGSANAVNLTDGLDGLAIGSVLIATATFAIITYAVGHALIANYLGIINIKGTGELTVFCGAVVGASIGFLWYNSHPAEIFMGDVGSMALGGSLGTLAVLTKQEILLVLVGGLFVIEAMSVILQVSSYRLTGNRIFKMAPLHHHFEHLGWKESKVVIRFWIVAIIFSLLSLATLKLR